MPLTRSFILRQLRRLPIDRGVRFDPIDNPRYAWVKCPIHSNGRERTPSLRINLDRSTEYRLGSYICFGCSEHGGWNDVAKILKLRRYKVSANDEFDLEISDQLRSSLLGDGAVTRELRAEFKFAPRWPHKQSWRTIPGWLLTRLDARLISSKYGDRLYIPVKIDREIVGGITCNFSDKAKRKYIYDSGTWIRISLFPFDYVKRLLRGKKRRIIFLVEGPRDALRLLRFDIPALAILGGKTVWRSAKADLLLTLDPDMVILGFDPDTIGKQVTELARAALRDQVQLKRLKFTLEHRHGKTVKNDPGNISEWRANRIKQQLRID